MDQRHASLAARRHKLGSPIKTTSLFSEAATTPTSAPTPRGSPGVIATGRSPLGIVFYRPLEEDLNV